MKCPKCGRPDYAYDYDPSIFFGLNYVLKELTFCPDCGERLREKCPKCEKMERIGRKFCETEVKKVYAMLTKHHRLKGFWMPSDFMLFIVSMLLPFLWFFIGMTCVEYHKISFDLFRHIMLFFMIPATLLGMIISGVTSKKLKQKFRQDFLRLHPEYKEIIEYAEKGDNS